ncbi:hypothetical protein XELAEV_18010434mg [Xenopus laevis]|uniref:Uncharacterized protein n=1 Tax=Xenopus laevis TaxID=8355 RepID=A0A974DUI3_XENLA|nr:hypothetical protein XELAEV_18010434mg [Xenopus laevis]
MADSHEESTNPQCNPEHNSEVSGNIVGIMQLMTQMPSKTDLQNWGTELKHAIKTETAVLKQEITTVHDTLEELEERVAQAEMATESNNLRRHTEDLENRSRWCNICIRVVSETVLNKELRDLATKLFTEVLNCKDPPKIEIERIHLYNNAVLKPLTNVLREQTHKGGKTYALRYPSDITLFCQQLDIRPPELHDWRNYVLGTPEDEVADSTQGTSANQKPRVDSTPPKQWRKRYTAHSLARQPNTPLSKRQS